MKKYVFGFLGFVLLIAIDQWTKSLAQIHLRSTDGISIISEVFELQYLENRGAAFGMLQGRRLFLILLTVLFMVGLIVLFHKIPAKRKYLPMQIILVLIAAGAVGNMIDRIWHHYVIDFLYFKLINFPIFNIADCYVVIGAICAIFYISFYYKEEDFEILMNKPKNGEKHE